MMMIVAVDDDDDDEDSLMNCVGDRDVSSLRAHLARIDVCDDWRRLSSSDKWLFLCMIVLDDDDAR